MVKKERPLEETTHPSQPLATVFPSDPHKPSITHDDVRAHLGSPRVGTFPPAGRKWPLHRLQYRGESIDVVFVCFDTAGEMLTCGFLPCTLFERDRAVSDAGTHLQIRTSTAVTPFREIRFAPACETHVAMRT